MVRAVEVPSLYGGTSAPKVDILNFGYGFEGYLREGIPNIQVLNNVIFGTSTLLTITFPPYWTRSGYRPQPRNPAIPCPVLLHGNGYGVENNNEQYGNPNRPGMQNPDPNDVLNVAMAHKKGIGVIAVYINNGGRESQGINYGLLDAIKGFFQSGAPAFGADISRIIAFGGSRGGGEAAVWGTLTTPNGMNVRTILSSVPPVRMASSAELSLSTFPGLGGPS
ncbi:MAG TPA: hypothetical protein VJ385_04685 [Fibrobacteria bacterium]|nr:hypothetical protein [Fibrobacteria bacterium]